MEANFIEIVEILAEDSGLVQSKFKFSNKLKIPGAHIERLMNNYKLGLTTNYDLMHELLREWIQREGDSATVAELRRILYENGFKHCADVLSNLDEQNPVLDSTYLKPSTIRFGELKPVLPAPFGFENLVLNFTGRQEELLKLGEYFNSGKCQIVLLSGLGGIGKTQLATKFALSIGNTKDSLIFKSYLQGDSVQVLKESIKDLYRHLNLTTSDSSQETLTIDKILENIIKQLQNNDKLQRWLVVIDNIDEMQDEFKTAIKTLQSFGSRMFLLLTSRRRDIISDGMKHLPLQVWSIDNSMEFIKTALEINEHASDKCIQDLCERLGNLPLALSQVLKYIQQQKLLSLKGENYCVRDYLAELSNNETTGLDNVPANYQSSALKTWSKTIDNLQTNKGFEGEVAVKIIEVICFIYPDRIKIPLVNRLYNRFYNTETTVEQIESSLKLLLSYSLISPSSDLLQVHRLVQLAVRKRIEENSSPKNIKTVEMLSQFWSSFCPNEWNQKEAYHFPSIWEHTCRFSELDNVRASKIHLLFDKLVNVGMQHKLQAFVREGCKLLLKLNSSDSVEYLKMQRAEAVVMNLNEQRSLSLQTLMSVYHKLEHLLGEHNAETLATAQWISHVLLLLDKKQESIKWCQLLLLAFDKITDTDEQTIVNTKQRVASTLYCLKMWREATKLYTEVLEWQKVNLGDTHLETLDTREIIAACLFNNSEYAVAQEKYEDLLSLREKLQVNGHWQIRLTRANLVACLEKNGKLTKN